MRKFVRFEKITVSDGNEIHTGGIFLVEGDLVYIETEVFELVVNLSHFTSSDGDTLIFKQFDKKVVLFSENETEIVEKTFHNKDILWWQKESIVRALTSDPGCVKYLRYLGGK